MFSAFALFFLESYPLKLDLRIGFALMVGAVYFVFMEGGWRLTFNHSGGYMKTLLVLLITLAAASAAIGQSRGGDEKLKRDPADIAVEQRGRAG